MVEGDFITKDHYDKHRYNDKNWKEGRFDDCPACHSWNPSGRKAISDFYGNWYWMCVFCYYLEFTNTGAGRKSNSW